MLVMSKKLLFCFIITISYSTTIPHVAEEELSPEIPIGNLALPGSQRPSPLFGFGQNIVDKHTFMGLMEADFIRGPHKSHTLITPQVLYGITDDFSVIIEFPIAAQLKDSGFSSSGPSDLFAQFEYAFYHKGTAHATKTMSFVASMFFPIGSDKKNPATGFGSPSFFLGVTASRLATEWYCYTAYGALLTTKHGHNTKAGNNFFYQARFGRNIAYATDKWLLMWMLEIIGLYNQKSRIHGITDPNSGGNTIIVTPSLWLSSKRLTFQFGVGLPVAQHLFGNQTKNKYLLASNVSWLF